LPARRRTRLSRVCQWLFRGGRTVAIGVAGSMKGKDGTSPGRAYGGCMGRERSRGLTDLRKPARRRQALWQVYAGSLVGGKEVAQESREAYTEESAR